MSNPHSKEQLKQLLLEKTGIETITEESCEKISIAIFRKNKNYVSKATLMRLFGLIPLGKDTISPVIVKMLEKFLQ